MEWDRLDALVFPQMRDALPPLHGPESIHETTVCETGCPRACRLHHLWRTVHAFAESRLG